MTTYEKAINTVITALVDNRIPFAVHLCHDGLQLRFPWCDGDVACHSGTYHSKFGYVESFEFPWDDGDVTELEPEEMAMRIVNYYYTIMYFPEEVKNND